MSTGAADTERLTIDDWRRMSPREGADTLTVRMQRLSVEQKKVALASLVDNFEEAFAEKKDGALCGVPCLVKDVFDVAGFPTHAGSSFLAKVRPPPHADSAMAKSLRNAGAVLIGKTHLHEFAYGLTGENLHYGSCSHPQFSERTSGGSSSGSAFVVGMGIVPMSIGTDTGGSIRLPAAYCGLFGLRLVPHHHYIKDLIGVTPRGFPLAPSFDTPGWFASTARDLRLINSALLHLQKTATPPRGLYLDRGDFPSEYALLAETLAARADADTEGYLWEKFKGSGQALTVLQSCEAFEIHKDWLDTYRDDYGPAIWQRIDRGRRWASQELSTAEAKLTSVRNAWTEYFKSYNFLILPAAPTAALKKSELTQENRDRILELTAPATLGGRPVLSVPLRMADGLTNGLQIVVNHPSSCVIDWALRELEGPFAS